MSPAYEFDDVRVDPAAFRATKAESPVSLEPKAFEVLLVLLEHPGRLVEKREILDRVWPDTVVTESAMTRVIADLRRALGDDAHGARYIETVPTKGYRFIAGVRRVDEAPAIAAPAAPPVTAAPPTQGRAAWVVAGATLLGLLVFAAVLFALRAPWSSTATTTAPSLARLTRVTDSLGVDAFPSFSPDGAQVAYCSDGDGPFEIYVRQLAPGGRGIRITSDGHDNQQPAWSPDGTRIAYASREIPGIWIVPALGGEPRRLTTFGSRPAWSPDAATIAFQSEPLSVMYAARPATTSPSSLWLIPAAGGDPVPLTRPGTPTGGHGSPVFSPDGNDVVFATTSEVWSVARKGGSVRRLLPRKEDEIGALRHVYYDPAFSPKGDLYFAHTDQSGRNSSLWRAHAPAGPGRSWGVPERVTPDATAWVRHIAVSRAGKVAYAGLSATSNLWSLPLDPKTSLPSSAAAPLTRVASPRATAPRFSPDGRRIAFVLWGTGASLNVCVVDANGGDARPITLGGGFGPEWLPDGTRIAFNAIREGKRGIWTVTLEGLTEKLLLPINADMLSTRLSPDRKHFAYHRESPNRELSTWVAPVDGGPERRVTPPELSAGYPCWSPDGRTLAVEILRPPDQFLGTIPAGGGPLTALVEENGLTYPWDFSPDGERISFAGQRDGVWNVYWVSRKDRSVQRLTDNTLRRTFLRYPAWSPRGDRIVYEQSETTGNIWLLEPAK